MCNGLFTNKLLIINSNSKGISNSSISSGTSQYIARIVEGLYNSIVVNYTLLKN